MVSQSPDLAERWTCDALEKGLVFFRGRLDACCVTHHGDRGHAVLVERFDGGEFPLGEVLEARKRILEQLQSPEGHPTCEGCIKLVKRKPLPRHYIFEDIIFAHHTHCNLRCHYCDSVQPGFKHVERPPKLFPIIRDLVGRGTIAPRSQIGWSGGEPTLLEEFDDMFAFFARMGTRQVVATNAVFLSKSMLQWIPTSLHRMYISVDAGTRETYRLIKGKDAFEEVWAHVAEYIKVGGRRVIPKMILVKENLGEVVSFVQRSHRAGAWTVICDPDRTQEDLDEDTVEAARIMLEECARRGIRLVIGWNTHHARPQKQFDLRVTRRYDEVLRDRAFLERVRQRIGTAKVIRHGLRLGTGCMH